MSENTNKIVARTHTAENLTVRETGITLFLVDKLMGSEAPPHYEGDPETLALAFREVATYAVRVFQEARCNVKALEAQDTKGVLDEKEQRKLSSAKKALADVEKFKRQGKLDRLIRAGARI